MWASLETTYTACTTSHMIESPAKVTDVLNSSRLPSKPPFISPLCLLVCFFIDFLPICIRQHAFFVVVFGCFGCLWEKIEFIWALSQVSCDVCLGSDCAFVCVWDRERRYKNPELITELRQSEDKQPCSLRLHIQTSQSGFYKWHKL